MSFIVSEYLRIANNAYIKLPRDILLRTHVFRLDHCLHQDGVCLKVCVFIYHSIFASIINPQRGAVDDLSDSGFLCAHQDIGDAGQIAHRLLIDILPCKFGIADSQDQEHISLHIFHDCTNILASIAEMILLKDSGSWLLSPCFL